jgi:D-serine deaminase-like pyridoxal phosphate-dependent protein
VLPAHVDPTVAMHEAMYLVDGQQVLERWPVDLRGW